MYQGVYVRVDEQGFAWLKVWADFSDPDDRTTAPDYQVADEMALGHVEGALSPVIGLLEPAEAELTKLANRWSRNHSEDYHQRVSDLIADLTRDYWHSAAPLNV